MKRRKFIIVFLIFLVLIICIVNYFINEYKEVYIINDANKLLEYLYTLDEGDYLFKNGIVYKDNKSVNNKYYLDGNGYINIDKYGNIKLLIDSNNKCITKTSLGDIFIENNKCNKFKKIDIKLVNNNSKVSFIIEEENLMYKLSKYDDFKGLWKEVKDENLVLKSFNENENYIWFKDDKGNISDTIKFNINCLNTNNTLYDSNVFYCSGSTIILDSMEWIVIEDNNESIKLMKYKPLANKLSHCYEEESGYCYYSKNGKNSYRWSNSYINYYLNNIFINKLSDETQKKLVSYEICDDYDLLNCNNESCGGYTKEDIQYYNWSCSNYVDSKIKIISYDEYNYLYSKIKNKSFLKGKYWSINSYQLDKSSTIQSNGEIYILENPTNKLDVKPVITISK